MRRAAAIALSLLPVALSAQEVRNYGLQASGNVGSPPAGAPDTWLPSQVSGVVREIMARVARNYEVLTGKATTGTGSAYVLTLAEAAPSAYERGRPISFTPHVASLASPTLNIDGLGAKAIVNGAGEALRAGDLSSGVTYLVFYDGTRFVAVVDEGAAFQLWRDATTGTTALSNSDRLLVGSGDVTGNPNRYITAENLELSVLQNPPGSSDPVRKVLQAASGAFSWVPFSDRDSSLGPATTTTNIPRAWTTIATVPADRRYLVTLLVGVRQTTSGNPVVQLSRTFEILPSALSSGGDFFWVGGGNGSDVPIGRVSIRYASGRLEAAPVDVSATSLTAVVRELLTPRSIFQADTVTITSSNGSRWVPIMRDVDGGDVVAVTFSEGGVATGPLGPNTLGGQTAMSLRTASDFGAGSYLQSGIEEGAPGLRVRYDSTSRALEAWYDASVGVTMWLEARSMSGIGHVDVGSPVTFTTDNQVRLVASGVQSQDLLLLKGAQTSGSYPASSNALVAVRHFGIATTNTIVGAASHSLYMDFPDSDIYFWRSRNASSGWDVYAGYDWERLGAASAAAAQVLTIRSGVLDPVPIAVSGIQSASLADADKLVFSDESETGDPNRTITAGNLRTSMQQGVNDLVAIPTPRFGSVTSTNDIGTSWTKVHEGLKSDDTLLLNLTATTGSGSTLASFERSIAYSAGDLASSNDPSLSIELGTGSADIRINGNEVQLRRGSSLTDLDAEAQASGYAAQDGQTAAFTGTSWTSIATGLQSGDLVAVTVLARLNASSPTVDPWYARTSIRSASWYGTGRKLFLRDDDSDSHVEVRFSSGTLEARTSGVASASDDGSSYGATSRVWKVSDFKRFPGDPLVNLASPGDSYENVQVSGGVVSRFLALPGDTILLNARSNHDVSALLLRLADVDATGSSVHVQQGSYRHFSLIRADSGNPVVAHGTYLLPNPSGAATVTVSVRHVH